MEEMTAPARDKQLSARMAPYESPYLAVFDVWVTFYLDQTQRQLANGFINKHFTGKSVLLPNQKVADKHMDAAYRVSGQSSTRITVGLWADGSLHIIGKPLV